VRAGAQVVLCDVDPHTLDYDFDQLQRIVDHETLCIVSPHLLGQTADIRRTKSIAKPFGVPVIEDAAQAMGRKTKEGCVGTLGDVGFFSLGRGKNVTAGSGGVIVTSSNDFADKLAKIYADICRSPYRVGSECRHGLCHDCLDSSSCHWLPHAFRF
jgi:dTDP-4-amino-4,6-dideoxygalactose transaminase